jgi:hypothetical protein
MVFLSGGKIMNSNEEMKILQQLGKSFDVPWQDIILIPSNSGIRFKLEKYIVGRADVTKKGIVKNIQTDNISQYETGVTT